LLPQAASYDIAVDPLVQKRLLVFSQEKLSLHPFTKRGKHCAGRKGMALDPSQTLEASEVLDALTFLQISKFV
jgi:hypothetical protein